jgi:hypothetical protein
MHTRLQMQTLFSKMDGWFRIFAYVPSRLFHVWYCTGASENCAVPNDSKIIKPSTRISELLGQELGGARALASRDPDHYVWGILRSHSAGNMFPCVLLGGISSVPDGKMTCLSPLTDQW